MPSQAIELEKLEQNVTKVKPRKPSAPPLRGLSSSDLNTIQRFLDNNSQNL